MMTNDGAVTLTPPAARVLVKEVNWLGDMIISLPALRAVRRAFPQAHLAVLVKRELASFFDGSASIDEVIPYWLRPGLRGVADRCRIIADLYARRFDLAVLFPKSFEAALWPALARVPRRAGFASDGRGWLLTDKTLRPPELMERHQAHDYLFMLHRTLGIDGCADDCTVDVHEPHRATVRAWVAERRRRPAGPLIALAVAAAYGPAKEWPAERYVALIDLLAERYGAECVLIGAPGERALCEQVASASKHGAIGAAGAMTLGKTLALLSLCDGFAGNDSGAMHAAAAVGIPTVGIYGSTCPKRTGPIGPRTRVIYHQIECSPCLARTCRFGHYQCLTQISADEVARVLEELGSFAGT